MKIFNVIVVFLAISMGCGIYKKESKVVSDKTYDLTINTHVVEVDNLNRLYVVDDKNKVINFSPENQELYRYANNRSGSVSTLDLSNPLRVVLFYDDFNHVKILDNTLSVITELGLSEMYSDITACSSSNDGHLWVYDPIKFRLLKIRDNGSILIESSNVNDFGMIEVQISEIAEKNNTVILCDRNKGFYFFDNLGQYKFYFSAQGIRTLHFDGRQIIFYTEKEGLQSFHVQTKILTPLPNPLQIQPNDDLKYILFHEGHYYYVYHEGINIYRKRAQEH